MAMVWRPVPGTELYRDGFATATEQHGNIIVDDHYKDTAYTLGTGRYQVHGFYSFAVSERTNQEPAKTWE